MGSSMEVAVLRLRLLPHRSTRETTAKFPCLLPVLPLRTHGRPLLHLVLTLSFSLPLLSWMPHHLSPLATCQPRTMFRLLLVELSMLMPAWLLPSLLPLRLSTLPTKESLPLTQLVPDLPLPTQSPVLSHLLQMPPPWRLSLPRLWRLDPV